MQLKKFPLKPTQLCIARRKKKKAINSKLFMIRKNAWHEMSLIGKENNY